MSKRRLGALAALSLATALVATALTGSPAAAATVTYGQDVSGYQGNVNWAAPWPNGGRFAYVKATEGTDYTQPVLRPAVQRLLQRRAHPRRLPLRDARTGRAARPRPTTSSTTAAAGRDGKTLPGAARHRVQPVRRHLLRAVPGGDGRLDQRLPEPVHTPHRPLTRRSTRPPTGGPPAPATTAASAPTRCGIARYSSAPGTLPAGAPTWSFWQYSSTGPFAGDSNQWHGALDRLKVLACDGAC